MNLSDPCSGPGRWTESKRHALRTLAAAALAGLAAVSAAAAPAGACPALLDRNFPRLQDEKPQDLCQYSGKVLVVVNTASYCGFTPQYKGLEALNERYRARGLVVLGFPTNDFGSQEPGSNKDIATFCENTFGVKFPMFAKTTVKGTEANPLFADLARSTGARPGWNFHKYVIGRDGHTVHSYPSKVTPDDAAFVADIERLLDAPAP
jgi:glutathione peroxidase